MSVESVDPGAVIGAHRGEVVVCIPVYGAHEFFVGCLGSVLAHTPTDVRILVADDASPDNRSIDFVRRLDEPGSSEHQILYLRREVNVGFPANVNGAFAVCAPADVVILNSDCVVAEGWLEGMREAAYSDSTIATVTALTNHGSLVSVSARGIPAGLPRNWNVDRTAAAVRASSLRLRPRLPTSIGHCIFVRRSALELVGDFDLTFSPGYGEEVDFSQRCLERGLCHVVADDVFVLHHGSGSFSKNGNRGAIQDEHERIVALRYPYYHRAVRACEQDISGPLGRALGCARRALTGMSVMIDARCLAGPTTGTQLHIVELIGALARSGRVRVTAIVPEQPSHYATAALGSLDDLTLLTRAQAESVSGTRADIIHRPFQVIDEDDLEMLARLSDRVVVTNQDLIGYHNPAYFRDFNAWEGYRSTTRSALSASDRVLFFSAHARDQALAEDLIEPSRASVVPIGVDHRFSEPAPLGVISPGWHAELPDGAEAILCIGTDFHHKNRVFALRVLEQLQEHHNWAGYLLLVGPRVARGSSAPREAEILAMHPHLAESVRAFPAVTELEKSWLYDRCRLVLYPTVHEGFGLVPFEAGDHGVPCLWAAGTSLSELLSDAAAEIVPWNAGQTADRAIALMRDDEARTRNLAAIRDAARDLTWDKTASKLIDVYTDTCNEPSAPNSRLRRERPLQPGARSEWATRLVGPNGALPEDLERPLLAVATHPALSVPMFGALRVGYRAGNAWRRRRLMR
ncbi:MAG: glycosyltransferase [Solirubrobacteraceae bacterium]